MRHHHYGWGILCAGLAVLSFVLFLQNQKLERRLAVTREALKQAPAMLRDEAEHFVRGFQATTAETFEKVYQDLILFRTMSDESEKSARELLQKRAGLVEKLNQTEPKTYAQAEEIVQADRNILQSFQDYIQLQGMHREKLIKRFDALADQLKLSPEP